MYVPDNLIVGQNNLIIYCINIFIHSFVYIHLLLFTQVQF
jgi:hypothetical protein